MKRRISALVLALTIAAWSVGCLSACRQKSNGIANYPVEVGGIKFVGPPSHVVCYSSTFIGIIYDMGYESQLMGRTVDCQYSQAEEITPYGTADNPSVNLIEGNPVDVVLTDETMPQKSIDSIQELGVPVVVIPRATGRSSFADMYSAIGSVFKGGNQGYNAGRKVANRILSQLDDISRLVEDEEMWNTCVILSSDLDDFATGDTLISAVLESVGGFNVAKDSVGGEYSLSDMMRSDPDVIICPAGVERRLRAKSNLVGVPAMDNFRVYAMDLTVFDDQYEGILKGAWRMAKILHPEVITDDMIPDGMVDNDFDEEVFTE